MHESSTLDQRANLLTHSVAKGTAKIWEAHIKNRSKFPQAELGFNGSTVG